MKAVGGRRSWRGGAFEPFRGVGVFYGFFIADKIGAANSVNSVGAVDADWHSSTLAPLAMFCPFVARFLLLLIHHREKA